MTPRQYAPGIVRYRPEYYPEVTTPPRAHHIVDPKNETILRCPSEKRSKIKKRKNYSKEFKARVAPDAIKGQKILRKWK